MGLSKTEVNLRRLLAVAPQQRNQAKLMHYVATLREQLEQLAEERTSDGLPRVSKALLNEYSEKIEAIAATLVSTEASTQDAEEPATETTFRDSNSLTEEYKVQSPGGLRRRPVTSSEQSTQKTISENSTARLVKLDAEAEAYIERHRKLQEALTDEMVGLARKLKESSLVMNESIRNTGKVLDSTEKAIEQSLASTGHAASRATNIYSQSSKTSCFTWLLFFAMTCIFVMVVLLIRIT